MDRKQIQEDRNQEAYKDVIAPLMDYDIAKIIPALDSLRGHSTEEQLHVYNQLHDKLETWRNIVSHYKRQALFDHCMETGHGGITHAGKILDVSRQRAHNMFKEAEAERLHQVTADDFF